ncbi:hypothetical protein [Calidithermus roseus]|uniref:Uncharacterized protein n=1 Tax=Calidithermus roseus TaxID=1644118 RepID=A0A399EYF1_9DEIN|nr:hypothetical protein [Calidithermus roseus]RIH88416.1 hypothetical protein Mrose_00825 [Calidithermus roseus]
MRSPSPTREFPASSLLLNYRPVLSGRIVLPRIGRPVAEMILKASASASRPEVGQPVVLDMEYGPEFYMSVLSVLEEQGVWRLRLVGGSGGLSRDVPARHYGRVRATQVIEDLLAEVDERIGSVQTTAVLPNWYRQEGVAYQALEALMVNLNRTWRMDNKGLVWVGEETWPVYAEKVPLAEYYVHQAKVRLEGLQPCLTPGVELFACGPGFDGKVGRVERVIHHFGLESYTEALCW